MNTSGPGGWVVSILAVGLLLPDMTRLTATPIDRHKSRARR